MARPSLFLVTTLCLAARAAGRLVAPTGGLVPAPIDGRLRAGLRRRGGFQAAASTAVFGRRNASAAASTGGRFRAVVGAAPVSAEAAALRRRGGYRPVGVFARARGLGRSARTCFSWLAAGRIAELIFVALASGLAFIASDGPITWVLTVFLKCDRSASSDAFGPFVTVLGLIYSIVLGQIYTYYFERQGVIQECLFGEAACLQQLVAAAVVLSERSPVVGAIRGHAQLLLDRACHGRTPDARGDADAYLASIGRLTLMLDTLSRAHPESTAALDLATAAVGELSALRAKRASALAGELPAVQRNTERFFAGAILFGFLLVDLGAPALESILFSVLVSSFFLIQNFLDDLVDPFGGSWNVDPAKAELEVLIAEIDAIATMGPRILAK